jgi:putative transposase
MSRRPRNELAGATYHLTARGNGGSPIFLDDFDRIYLLDLVARAVDELRWRCFAYCLMENHYHLLVRTTEPNLSQGMRMIQTRHARRFNTRHGRHGHLFGDRFHDTRIDGERHLLAAAAYIARNPVRAGIVDKACAWPWSSFRATAGHDPPGFLDVESLLEILSPDPNRARCLFTELVESDDGHR